MGHEICTPSNVHVPLDLWPLGTVDDLQVGHFNQVGHLSKPPLNLLEIHDIRPVDTTVSKQQNYDQI